MLAQTAEKIREQMARFSGKLSQGLSKPARRFVGEMISGIQAAQSVQLSTIGRSLGEAVPLLKTVKRLSENLIRRELRAVIAAALLREGAKRIGEDSLLVLDLSDLRKPYAEKMEHLAWVRDGSTGELGRGYWLCQVIGTENRVEEEATAITPLYGELYSQEAPDFVSENREILRAIQEVSAATASRGIWVIDRGGDRGELYEELVPAEKGRRFLIRQMGNRDLLWDRRKLATAEVVRRCALPYATTVIREDHGQEKVYHLEYGFAAVRLPEQPEVPLALVVVKGFGEEPMLLLTNLALRKNRKVLWWVVSAYLTRWRIEETIRFVKQSYELEDVRVLRYERRRNLLVLVTAAMFFAAVVLGRQAKLKVLVGHALAAAKRLFGIPDFCYYAVADGLHAIFSRYPRSSPSLLTHQAHASPPLPLFDT
jgi:hypothetical protein